MIKNHLPAVLIALIALAAPALAAETTSDPGPQREFHARMKVCEACHGQNGVPKTATIPIITGQQENYLAKQIHDFRSGDRKIEVMAWMADALSESELEPTVANFAKKTWPSRSAGAASVPPPRGVAVCQSCHQQNFLGAAQAEGMTTPRLAGQNYEYLVEAMGRFADGERTNNADMVQIMKAISPADREAMARYLSSL
ncbi:MAG TPA: c-type cytochrome [Micropepsaceae bacterium]